MVAKPPGDPGGFFYGANDRITVFSSSYMVRFGVKNCEVVEGGMIVFTGGKEFHVFCFWC